MFRQVSQQVRLYLVLFLLGIVPRRFPAVVAPRFFDHALFAEEISAFQCAFFIGGFEDDTISQIQGEDPCFFTAEWRDE